MKTDIKIFADEFYPELPKKSGLSAACSYLVTMHSAGLNNYLGKPILLRTD
ncbi:MAG: hypothetical protein PHV30_08245 [Candidatus Margulisbacteria bacterium]|nr:hypothetical protein [Candidatus Margulisiibacteriota bacterium]